jgi:hypothetical protein
MPILVVMSNFAVPHSRFDNNARYLQFRWELFNAPNHVNLCAATSNCPDTTIGLSTTGKIFNAGDARAMQLALKFVF